MFLRDDGMAVGFWFGCRAGNGGCTRELEGDSGVCAFGMTMEFTWQEIYHSAEVK